MQFKRNIRLLLLLLILLQSKNLWSQPPLGDYPTEKIQLHFSQQNLFPGEILWFKIYCISSLFPKEDLSNLAFVELVSPDNTSVLRKKVLLKNGQGAGEFEIPKDLKTGVYFVLAYTNWQKNFGESTFFRKEILIINPAQPLQSKATADSVKSVSKDKQEFAILSDNKSYHTRSLVSLRFEGKVIPKSYSVSVFRKEPEIQIITSRKVVLDDNPLKIKFLPDYHGIRIGGKLTSASGEAIKNGTVLASIPGSGIDLKESHSDQNGNINFLLKAGEGEKELIFNLPETGARFTPEDMFVNGFSTFGTAEFKLNPASMDFLKKKYLHFQLQKGFNQSWLVPAKRSAQSKDSTVFYSGSFTSIKLKEYTKLDSLREYFYELVPSVKFSRKDGGLDVSIYDAQTHTTLKDKPAIFLDGVFYPDFSAISKIPLDEIDYFNVIAKEYYYLDFTFGGIIDVHTKKSDFNSVPLSSEMSRILYPLANEKEWIFNPPVYKENNNRVPDFRYLLYWNPNLQDTESIQFYTGDVKGTFVIKIMGITEEGKIVESENEIEVN
jgi:hypothetical protein